MDITHLKNKVIAIDFDNTITSLSKPPVTGKININAIEQIKELKKNNKIILWTCREDEELIEAIELCKKYGLVFDKVNENINGTYSRKIRADIYIDDKAMPPNW